MTRHFSSFSAAAQEAGLSRIYAGQHFRSDHIAGKALGRQVAEFIDETILLPRSPSENWGLKALQPSRAEL